MQNRLWLSLILCLCMQTCFAVIPKAGNEPVDFQADFIDINNKTGIGHYDGHVRLQQGESIITAPRAESYRGEDHKISKAIAYGDKKTKARLETKPEPKQEKMIATANKITYLAASHQVVLEGDALVIQGQHQIKAPKIIYDMIRDTVHFENGSYSGKGSQ